MKIMTLTCTSCNADWTRPSQRGRPPLLCPSCKETEAAKPKPAVARKERTTASHSEAIARVAAYRAWVKADADYHFAKMEGMPLPVKPKMPALPSDHDYSIAREVSNV